MKPLFFCSLLLAFHLDSMAQCAPTSWVKDPPATDPCLSNRIARPFPVAYPSLREADVMWSKRIWRVIDLREKMNLALYYPTEPTVCEQSLFDVLKCALLQKDLHAFANPVFDDEFTTAMTKPEIASLLVSWDSTFQVEDVNNPGTFISQPLKKEITASMVRQYWIKEDWYFDKQRSVMEVRIIGICPLVAKVAENGDVVGVRPLFWIYFPEARPYLARAAAFNFHNDMERMSYDEVFEKRRFESYIYKESNVYNRSIADYTNGLGAQLESEEIKEDVFKFEDNLWHK